MYRHLAICIVAICLSACGFKLRGMIDIPTWLNNVAIVSEDGNNDLFMALRTQLKANNIAVNSDPTKAAYLLVLLHTTQDQQLSSVAASTAPRQYQLTYKVNFILKTRDGKDKIPASYVIVTRQLTINNDRILGSNDEANLILEEMRRDIAVQIVNKLGS